MKNIPKSIGGLSLKSRPNGKPPKRVFAQAVIQFGAETRYVETDNANGSTSRQDQIETVKENYIPLASQDSGAVASLIGLVYATPRR